MAYFKKDPTKIPIIWYYPPELGVNTLLEIAANMQDGTGNYDLRFGNAFYDFSFFKDISQEDMLKRIKLPTCILHVAPSKETAPSYYTEDGLLISAMDEKDAKRVNELIYGSTLFEGFESMHDIHFDCPEEYINSIEKFLDTL